VSQKYVNHWKARVSPQFVLNIFVARASVKIDSNSLVILNLIFFLAWKGRPNFSWVYCSDRTVMN